VSGGNVLTAPFYRWTKLANWTTIRELRDLKTFRLSIGSFRQTHSDALARDIERGIQEVVLKDGGKGKGRAQVVEMLDVLRGKYENPQISISKPKRPGRLPDEDDSDL
jgi:hypothetical protein